MGLSNHRVCLFAALLVSGLAQAASGVGARIAGIARTQDGKPDLTGIWQAISTADYDLEPHSTRKDAPLVAEESSLAR